MVPKKHEYFQIYLQDNAGERCLWEEEKISLKDLTIEDWLNNL